MWFCIVNVRFINLLGGKERMLIRTQLGELVNLNNIGIVRISEENKLIASCNNEEYVLAEYKTKEKARKSLSCFIVMNHKKYNKNRESITKITKSKKQNHNRA